MPLTKATVDLLRVAWSQGVQEILDRELEVVKNALVNAGSTDLIFMLQGKAKAYQAMSKFPEYVANFIEAPPDA